MPKMSDPTTAPPCRVMLIGDSGTGKTGALASLALAGYNLYIADFDNGMEILRNLVAAKNPKALANIEFETFRDRYKTQGANVVPLEAIAWSNGLKWLQSIFERGLTRQDIVVLDSLSFAARQALNYILKINNRMAAPPWQSDWGEAQRMVSNALGMICDDRLECHIICTAHIAVTGGKKVERIQGKDPVIIDEGPVRKLPSMVGKAINPEVPRYFNHMLLTHRVGSGSAAKRTIKTETFDDIELKNTNPGVIKPEYPLATGLADYFKDATGAMPQAKAA